MLRRLLAALLCAAALASIMPATTARAEQAYGRVWGQGYNMHDWERFYHYPYVYYPQNFWSNEYYRSAEDLYYRYPQEMRVPVYNRQWHNEYPQPRRYYSGHQFNLDVF